MTLLRLAFAGQIKKAEHKTAAGKTLVEVSVCRKNKTKDGEPEAWTWVRASIWEPAEFQIGKLAVGNFIAGSGEMVLRSYTDKSGAKGVSCEVSCRSFDIEVATTAEEKAEQWPQRPARPAAPVQNAPAAGAGESDVPFARSEWEMIP